MNCSRQPGKWSPVIFKEEGEKGEERENEVIIPNVFFFKTLLQVKNTTRLLKAVCSKKEYPCLLFGVLPR